MSLPAAADVAVDALGMTPRNYGHLVTMAARCARERLDGHSVVNRQTRVPIVLAWPRGLENAAAPGVPPVLLMAMPAIPAMLTTARYLGAFANPPLPPDVVRYHVFGAAAEIGGRRIDAMIIVRENRQCRYFFDRLVGRDGLPRRQEGGANPTDSANLPTLDDDSYRTTRDSLGGVADTGGGDGRFANAATNSGAAVQQDAGNAPQTSVKGVPVVLPTGSRIPADCVTGCLMSPVADLRPVAATGRDVGRAYIEMLNTPETAAGAAPALYAGLGMHVGHGGTFDYQRQGSHITGFAQFPQYRDVSNFNVGLLCQQAGLSLDKTLGIAGGFARFFSSDAKADQPYHLDPRTAAFIRAGYNVGASGVFGQAVTP
jgi:hypothetical protein